MGDVSGEPGENEEGNRRHAGHQAEEREHRPGDADGARVAHDLAADARAQVGVSEARVTRMPAPTEMTSAGIWATKPSPMDSSVNFWSDSASDRSI